MKPSMEALQRVAAWLQRPISPEQTARLVRFHSWIVDEAVQIGGVGPDEANRSWDRHVLDSLVFACELVSGAAVLDVGTGVGLPGIPVALVHDGPVTLLDRSGRRVDALHRISAVLELEVEIVHADVATVARPFERVLFRASLPLPAARSHLHRLCAGGGSAMFGLGRGREPESLRAWQEATPPTDVAEALVEVPSGVLDSPAWLLRMTPL